jgi:hypothetical protein
MAELKIEGNDLVLHLSRLEKVESVHADLRVALSAIRSIEVLDDAHEPADHGFKVGERLPGVSEVATIHTGETSIFAVVHRDTPRGVRIVLEGAANDEWIIGCADPEGMKSLIDARRP